MTRPEPLPSFERPPVIEVVCGMTFKPLDGLLAPHLGLLWEKLKQDGYTKCQEVAPLAPAVEQFDGPQSPSFEVTDTPPLARIWFTRDDENGIIQVQRDRFLHNWKKARPGDEYPHYDAVIAKFREKLASFEAFVLDAEVGQLEPQQYEMTYVNHIMQGNGWHSLREIGKVFPDVGWRDQTGRFLHSLEAVNIRLSFVLPNRSGRLHATIRTALRRQDGFPMLLLDMTARGIPKEHSRDAMWEWFDIAHEWIVRGFADLTGPEMQGPVWSRS